MQTFRLFQLPKLWLFIAQKNGVLIILLIFNKTKLFIYIIERHLYIIMHSQIYSSTNNIFYPDNTCYLDFLHKITFCLFINAMLFNRDVILHDFVEVTFNIIFLNKKYFTRCHKRYSNVKKKVENDCNFSAVSYTSVNGSLRKIYRTFNTYARFFSFLLLQILYRSLSYNYGLDEAKNKLLSFMIFIRISMLNIDNVTVY